MTNSEDKWTNKNINGSVRKYLKIVTVKLEDTGERVDVLWMDNYYDDKNEMPGLRMYVPKVYSIRALQIAWQGYKQLSQDKERSGLHHLFKNCDIADERKHPVDDVATSTISAFDYDNVVIVEFNHHDDNCNCKAQTS
jgi:hypothetical protein